MDKRSIQLKSWWLEKYLSSGMPTVAWKGLSQDKPQAAIRLACLYYKVTVIYMYILLFFLTSFNFTDWQSCRHIIMSMCIWYSLTYIWLIHIMLRLSKIQPGDEDSSYNHKRTDFNDTRYGVFYITNSSTFALVGQPHLAFGRDVLCLISRREGGVRVKLLLTLINLIKDFFILLYFEVLNYKYYDLV